MPHREAWKRKQQEKFLQPALWSLKEKYGEEVRTREREQRRESNLSLDKSDSNSQFTFLLTKDHQAFILAVSNCFKLLQ